MGRTFNRAWRGVQDALGAAAYAVAPEKVLRRRQLARIDRLHARMIDQAGEPSARAAAKTDRMSGDWLVSGLSPDSELERDLPAVRQRMRELAESHPMVAGFLRSRVTNIVGTGFSPQSQPVVTETCDETRAKAVAKQIELIWRRTECRIDVSGRRSLCQQLRLAVRCYDRDGEAFIVLTDKPMPGKPIPLTVEVVDPERVDTPPSEAGNPSVRLGIKRASDGTPTHYYIRANQPNDTVDCEERYESIPADRVMHLYSPIQPGQSRGWPMLESAERSLDQLRGHDEAVLMGRRVEACLSVLIQSPHSASLAEAAAVGPGREETLSPAGIRYIGEHDTVTTVSPAKGSGGDHAAFMNYHQEGIAAAGGMPVEMFRRCYSGMNYSSGRLAILDAEADFSCEQQLIRELILIRLWELAVRQMVALGLIDVLPIEFLASPHDWTNHYWINTARPWVDPLKEMKANELAVDCGFTARANVSNRAGTDDDTIQDQRLREAKGDADRDLELAIHRVDCEAKLVAYRQSKGLDANTEPADATRAEEADE